jgi:hypothetical protein
VSLFLCLYFKSLLKNLEFVVLQFRIQIWSAENLLFQDYPFPQEVLEVVLCKEALSSVFHRVNLQAVSKSLLAAGCNGEDLLENFL